MPPTQNPLTPADYLLFNEMVTQIRTLEYIATQHFFNGDSDRRADIVRRVKQRVYNAHRMLFPVPPDVTPGGVAPIGITSAARCNFPYCASSSGICELCGLAEIQQQLLAALVSIGQ
jgi:hypothetical protein